MKIIYTKREALRECKKILRRKNRYTDKMDKELFEEVMNKTATPVYIRGIEVVPQEPILINGTRCILFTLYNPFAVYLFGNSVAMCVTDTVNQLVMFVDDDYMEMSLNTKRFIKYHEVGHIVLNHEFIPGQRDIQKEYEADKYASKFADGFEALFEVKRNKRSIELSRRIRELKKK